MASKPFTALLVAAVVLLAGCSGATTTTPAAGAGANGADSATNSVTASGTATVTASPDTAVITVAVEATAENASAARSQVAADANALRDALADAGYEVHTVDYQLSPQYDHSGDTRERTGFRAYHVFQFETTPDDAGHAVDVAVDNGASAVQSVRFTLSDEKRAELRSEALAAAVGDARDEAETVASAANRSVGTELSMQVGSADYSAYEVRLTADAASGGTSFEPGPVTVSASVTVTYELE
ncbi:SIMPL domain-containing protein [Halobaculum sp. P14]|uniref:SIMPL domain-containing protein n=1 Tax=Halobaculum sp. P14 TaxID=3421638 RepID=UPI003EB9390C